MFPWVFWPLGQVVSCISMITFNITFNYTALNFWWQNFLDFFLYTADLWKNIENWRSWKTQFFELAILIFFFFCIIPMKINSAFILDILYFCIVRVPSESWKRGGPKHLYQQCIQAEVFFFADTFFLEQSTTRVLLINFCSFASLIFLVSERCGGGGSLRRKVANWTRSRTRTIKRGAS